MKSSHTFRADSAVFDETNLVSSAGLVPVLELAEQAGLSELIDVHVDIDSARVKSGAANPVGKLTSIIAGMCTGADYIDDMNLLRAGGMPALFDQVYAPSTLGIFLREFTFGHSLQLGAVLRRHLIALAARTPLLPGIEDRAFLDIDSLLRPVYGHAKEGASYGHAKVSGRTVLRKGLNPLVTTLSTAQAAPVVTEMRLRGGKTGSGRGAASQLRSAITTARACGATGKIMARGDSAFGNKAVIGAAIAAGIEFSVGMTRNPRITRAIDSIDEQDWVPVHYEPSWTRWRLLI
ncbi:IS1380 family transposase ISMva3 [Rhodococcus sp. T7]|nr:IS1380 family transposase ISMva3 [Rhodococcus sp. T7]